MTSYELVHCNPLHVLPVKSWNEITDVIFHKIKAAKGSSFD